MVLLGLTFPLITILLTLTNSSHFSLAFKILHLDTPFLKTTTIHAFQTVRQSRILSSRRHGDDDHDLRPPPHDSSLHFEDAFFLERFKRRRDESSSQVPSASPPPAESFHDPKNVVSFLLAILRRPHRPSPYFGYEALYSMSTERWRDVLRKSAGARRDATEEWIARALSACMEREDTQFGILVGMGLEDGTSSFDDDDENDCYEVEFPFDTLDYYDGTAWLECRLRNKKTDALLVVSGWSMRQRDGDGVWLVDGMDWQDFREKYRPGIGREMWERICG